MTPPVLRSFLSSLFSLSFYSLSVLFISFLFVLVSILSLFLFFSLASSICFSYLVVDFFLPSHPLFSTCLLLLLLVWSYFPFSFLPLIEFYSELYLLLFFSTLISSLLLLLLILYLILLLLSSLSHRKCVLIILRSLFFYYLFGQWILAAIYDIVI